jgi:adenylate cyclase
LVFNNVPAERGLICMCTPSGQLQPVAVRTVDDPHMQPKVKISLSIANEAIHSASSLLVADVASDQRFAGQQSIRVLNITSAMCVPLYREGHVDGLIYVDTQSRVKPFGEDHLRVLTALSLFSAVAIEQGRLRDEIAAEQKKREKLSRYHSEAVVEQILADAQTDGLITQEQEVSVLFADLCGFTAMSEKLNNPADIVKLLNTVFELLSQSVFDYKGTLDKFMGDGMLAFFGAPIPQKNHAERAVRAALKMQEALAKYNEGLPMDSPKIGMRVGINSGPAVVGDIGSTNRKDYTVIGGTVNIASRLESSVARPGQVVIGPRTYELVKSVITCQKLDPVPLKGINAPVSPYLAEEIEPGRETQMLAFDDEGS